MLKSKETRNFGNYITDLHYANNLLLFLEITICVCNIYKCIIA